MPALFYDLIDFGYLRLTLCAILLASVACGIVGAYIVAQRQSYMIGTVSHSLLGGVGLARFLQVACGVLWFSPLVGATLAAVTAATAITFLTLKTKARADAVLSAIWTLGVALGVSFIAMTPGYTEDLNSYLFGSILLITPNDLVFMAVMDVLIAMTAFLFHNRFLTFCFRPETLELRGLSPFTTALMLNLLIALTVVLLAQVVGIVLVLVLLVLPPAFSAIFAKRLPAIMLLAGLVCLAACFTGLVISYEFDWPTGATIVEVTVALFLIAHIVKGIARKKTKP